MRVDVAGDPQRRDAVGDEVVPHPQRLLRHQQTERVVIKLCPAGVAHPLVGLHVGAEAPPQVDGGKRAEPVDDRRGNLRGGDEVAPRPRQHRCDVPRRRHVGVRQHDSLDVGAEAMQHLPGVGAMLDDLEQAHVEVPPEPRAGPLTSQQVEAWLGRVDDALEADQRPLPVGSGGAHCHHGDVSGRRAGTREDGVPWCRCPVRFEVDQPALPRRVGAAAQAGDLRPRVRMVRLQGRAHRPQRHPHREAPSETRLRGHVELVPPALDGVDDQRAHQTVRRVHRLYVE